MAAGDFIEIANYRDLGQFTESDEMTFAARKCRLFSQMGMVEQVRK